ncbi:MAG: GMC family oxidoreductase N-terminal domain-containing protein, partial [Bacteroidetes bacterium]|nr:GMC family oxidoreductase N-terminal domain-containing protein [Bacteroidota bacterium]
GSFGSPHILMLSGIGNQDHLSDVGIDPIHHLPGVGQNLQDHLILGLCSTTDQPVSFNTKETLGNLLTYLFSKKGPFSASPLEACAFYKTDPSLDRPDMQLHFAPAHGSDMHDHTSFPRDHDGYSILPTLIRPKSVGEITLKSSDPFEYPNINPKYFSHPEDLEIMMRGVRMALELFKTEAFAPFIDKISMPEKYDTDEDLLNHIMDKVETCYHPVGTCKMGHDEMAVVDDELNVRGIANLRVADASIMPTIISGNTNAPTIMIAEKAADFIISKKSIPLQAEKSI